MLTPFESGNAIIAIVRNQAVHDMIVHQQRYYLPVRHMALVADAQLIAFYMPAWYTPCPHHITCVAQIGAYTILPRHCIWPDALQHPRAAQLYIVLSLQALTALTPAIPSPRWRRIGVHGIQIPTLARLPYLGKRVSTPPIHLHYDACTDP